MKNKKNRIKLVFLISVITCFNYCTSGDKKNQTYNKDTAFIEQQDTNITVVESQPLTTEQKDSLSAIKEETLNLQTTSKEVQTLKVLEKEVNYATAETQKTKDVAINKIQNKQVPVKTERVENKLIPQLKITTTKTSEDSVTVNKNLATSQQTGTSDFLKSSPHVKFNPTQFSLRDNSQFLDKNYFWWWPLRPGGVRYF